MNLRKVALLSLAALIATAVFSHSVPAFSQENSKIPGVKKILFPDIIKMGSDALVAKGTMVNSVVSFGGSVLVAGEVVKDAVAIGGSVSLKPSARVHGDVVAIGGKINKEPGAKIAGEIKEVFMPNSFSHLTAYSAQCGPAMMYFVSVAANVLWFVSMLVVGLTAGFLFPKKVGWTSAAIERHPVKAFFWGLLWTMLFVPIAILLVCSIIGVPLIVLQMVLYALALVLGYVSLNISAKNSSQYSKCIISQC
ncbi:MAG: polymer-forming cytoskeletal protein [Deltaproteobacteria bacterium]